MPEENSQDAIVAAGKNFPTSLTRAPQPALRLWRWGIWVWVLICWGVQPAALASDRVAVEYAKGIVAYGEGDYLTALDHFRTAVELAPDNSDALFYLGLSLNRVGEFAAAIPVLDKVLQLDASLQYVHYHLGLAYFQEARYADALSHFQAAEQHDPRRAETQFYLGYTQYQLKRYRQALPPLQRALDLDPALALSSQYYQGLAWYALERDQQAQEAFQAAIAASPESSTAENARRYLDALKARAADNRLLQFQGAVSFQYDDNVILAPNDDILEFGNQADGRTVLSVLGRVLPIRTAPWRLGAEYAFFQSLHFTLSDFDLQTHTARVFSQVKLQRTTLSLAADYTFTRLANERFSAALTVNPSVFVQPTDNLLTVASVRYRQSDFFNQSISEGQEDVRDRDGWSVQAGVDQFLTFNRQRSYVRLGYAYEASRNQGSDWEYDSHQVGMGLHTPLVWAIGLDTDVAYYRRNYLHINSFDDGELAVLEPGIDTHKRRDQNITASLLLSRKLGSHLQLSAGFVHTRNLSNIDFFDYRRNIWTVSLSGRF